MTERPMKTNPQKGAYPTWSDLLAILGIYLVAMLAFNLGGGLLLRFGIRVARGRS